MSIVNYLGCDFILPLSDDDCTDEILIGSNFSEVQDRENVRKHFSTKYKYVYEIYSNEFVGIWFNDYYKSEYPKSNKEGQQNFKALCDLLDNHLSEGDHCQLYTCWVGDELDERKVEFDQTITLNNYDIGDIELYEKTLLVIKK
ncbi:hypothetical protein AB1K18_13950 [Peribacillus simplex]|uniref:hypothetical protein n=1 Tax=Peribacillus simplex TaxID=1478 RepID=UPI003B8D6CF9